MILFRRGQKEKFLINFTSKTHKNWRHFSVFFSKNKILSEFQICSTFSHAIILLERFLGEIYSANFASPFVGIKVLQALLSIKPFCERLTTKLTKKPSMMNFYSATKLYRKLRDVCWGNLEFTRLPCNKLLKQIH